jgi:prepilin signal peptidase PulO-like enzyme (type II secretory pathway)
VNIFLAIPLPVRLGGLFLLGLAVAGLINLCVYRLAWTPRSISPWSAPPQGAPPRRGRDRIPLYGWWALARESALHGRGFWIRPLVVELFTGLLFAGLYLWETRYLALYSFVRVDAPSPQAMLATDLELVVHVQFLGHLVLVSLMIVASLIDLDEQTIPDAVTIPGTLLGLAMATVYPWSLLPGGVWLAGGKPVIEFLTLASPDIWPAALGPGLGIVPLAIAIGCWTLWCGGIMPRRWNTRHGWTTAVRVFFHRLRVEQVTYAILRMWLVGAVAILLIAWLAPAANGAALLTALVGMAVGGGLIWIVRVIGTATLRREAMGFGDVMLMSMIGTFVGWQGALIVFFLAPMFGLVNGIIQWTMRRESEIPYGPYLCLATLLVILKWAALWNWTADMFAMGGLLFALLSVCLVLMGGMLWFYRIVRESLIHRQ